jgi:hypothetical protein
MWPLDPAENQLVAAGGVGTEGGRKNFRRSEEKAHTDWRQSVWKGIYEISWISSFGEVSWFVRDACWYKPWRDLALDLMSMYVFTLSHCLSVVATDATLCVFLRPVLSSPFCLIFGLIFWLNISFNRIMTFGFAQIGLDPNIKKKTPSKRSRKSRGYQLNILLRYLKILLIVIKW